MPELPWAPGAVVSASAPTEASAAVRMAFSHAIKAGIVTFDDPEMAPEDAKVGVANDECWSDGSDGSSAAGLDSTAEDWAALESRGAVGDTDVCGSGSDADGGVGIPKQDDANGRDSRFACRFCEYQSRQQGHVKRHELRHTGDKPFGCRFCEYRSSQQASVKRHELRHTGDKPFG